MAQYKTRQGDTWDMISYEVYGTELLFPLLMNENQAYANVFIFDAGVTIQVPDMPEETSEDLPPWKRDDGT